MQYSLICSSVERREYQAILHASFMPDEIRPVIGNDDHVLDELCSADEIHVVGNGANGREIQEAVRE